jgi:tripartite-type tricarboxylate transporter receptor subunit TctC
MSLSARLPFVVLLLAAGIAPVSAQSSYPEKSIRMIYGFPPGNDVAVRILSDKLADVLGKPVIVDNVTGAGGNIAADRTAKAAPDGYTVGALANANITIGATLYKKLPYDPVRELTPVTQFVGYANLLLVNNDVPVKSVAELAAMARAQPGKLTFGHNGVGTTSHLSGELFKSMARIDIQDVPYRGPAPLLNDLMTGRISMTFNSPGATLPLISEGKLRALAVTSRSHVPFAPDLPTMEETGYEGFETTVWFGLFVPAGTPGPIVDRLNRETMKIMALPDVRRKFNDIGVVPLSSTPAEFAQIIRTETPYWARTISDAGIKAIE